MRRWRYCSDLAADDPALRAFDEGALETLTYYRTATARNDREQRYRVGLAALDLMTVVQRLAPRDTVIDLHRRFAYWNAWTETLVLDRGLDLRREYWRVLALTQDIAAEAGLAPRRLLPFWLDVCGEAGRRGRYDESYLTVGLLGIRSLPLGEEEAANEEAALHGLARWADAQRPAKKRFLREWHVLEGAFPRDPTFWTDLVARVVASVGEEIARQTNNARKKFHAAEWWLEDVDFIRDARAKPRAAELEPPPRELLQSVLGDIEAKKPFSGLRPRLQALIAGHERYASITGDTFYLVRTACNIGTQLLREGDDFVRRATTARELAHLALHFEPANIYAWTLWRKALAAEGHAEAAELVGWETIRRFPEDPQWRSELASLLDQFGRPQEAEALLHETLKLFPDDVIVAIQLAQLLVDQLDRPQEAEALLQGTLKLFPNNVVARTQLAEIVGREAKRLKEAIAVLDDTLKIAPTDQIAQSMKHRFERGQTSSAPQPAALTRPTAAVTAASVDLPVDLAASARMRRALFRVQTAAQDAREAAKEKVQAILNEDENLAYARYVAVAAGITEPASDDSVHAVAYLAAVRNGSDEAMQRFSTQWHGLDGVVISLASASRGDEEAATRLKAWMVEPANDLSAREKSIRIRAQQVTSPLRADFVADMLAASLGIAMAA